MFNKLKHLFELLMFHMFGILLRCLLYHQYTTIEDIKVTRKGNTQLVVASKDNVGSEVARLYNGLLGENIVRRTMLRLLDCVTNLRCCWLGEHCEDFQ